MARKPFALRYIEAPESYPPEFLSHFQFALLLSLLERGLLTQQQFERCAEKIQKESE